MNIHQHKLKILLVDDDEDYYVITKGLLSEIDSRKFDLHWASTYDDAVKAIKEDQHDIYLFDYRIGTYTGLDLLRKVVEEGRKKPVIILTGQGDREVDIMAMKAGAADFLAKGQLDASLLERSIRYAIERKRAEVSLQEAMDYSKNLIDCSLDMIIAVDMERKITEFNNAAEESFGYSKSEMLGKPIEILFENPYLGVELNKKTLEEEKFSGEAIKKTKDGKTFIAYISSSVLRNSNKQIVGVMSILHDTTEQKRLEEKLLHDALHDPLTGLPNRTLFMNRLEHSIARSKRDSEYKFAVLFLDLDRFKIVNDSLGHIIGDELLVTIADRLSKPLRANDMLARLGGDEFAVLLDNIKATKNASLVASRILKEFESPFNLNGHIVFSTASIGIVLNNIEYNKPDDIIRDADTVMYRAKALGKARYAIFDMGMHAHAVQLMQLEADMRKAIDNKEFLLHYQPIISLEDGKITGMEALVRWQHPQRGLIPPDKFIPLAEETGLIIPIGEWVLHTACAQNKTWHDNGYPDLKIAVNFSGYQFQHKGLFEKIKSILKETGMPAHALEVEITESTIMKNVNIDTLKELSDMGVKVSIDDFGTGYSTLSSLRELPIDMLKIDRSFIKDITLDSDAEAITSAIIAMAHTLKLNVLAEGVEKEAQLTFLQTQKCDKIQGFLFSKPLPAEEIMTLLKTKKPLARISHESVSSEG